MAGGPAFRRRPPDQVELGINGRSSLDDLLVVVVTFIFTVAGLIYVAGCERL